MEQLAAYLAGALTVLVIINAWYVIVRLWKGWRAVKATDRGNR